MRTLGILYYNVVFYESFSEKKCVFSIENNDNKNARIMTEQELLSLRDHDEVAKVKFKERIVGAFGCGAFKTPPNEMALLFKQVMAEEEFIDRYRLITFAILSDHNDHSNNHIAFREVIMGK